MTMSATQSTTAATTWRDSKRYLWLFGLVVPLFPFGGAYLAQAHGWRAAWWMGPIWILFIIPFLDAVSGTDQSNPPESAAASLDKDLYYRWCTFLFFPLEIAALAFGCWTVAKHPDLPLVDWLGLALTVGAVSGVGIANAHELGHKKEQVERWLARLVLAPSAYGHFFVEHNRGHHNRVATPEDPATARLGESFWQFLPRSVVGAVRSAWRLEAQRLERHRQSVWSWHNEVLTAWLMTVVLFAALVAVFGPQVLGFLVVQAVFGFSLLEVVNYLEHYGLLRQKKADGHYERCTPQHSWNSNHVASNVFLYHLERHSDHHANPARRYQALRHFPESPQLPSGYGLMLALAYIPPVWRAVMDKRVVAHYGGDVTLANIHPPARAAILAKWGKR